ncbi:MAG: DUF4124 domain-containing protein [Pseudomonadota bacterium]
MFFTGALLLLGNPAGAEVYKWHNENNEVQYTQMPPPPGIEYVVIQTAEHAAALQAGGTNGAAEQPAEPDAAATDAARAKSEYEAEVARISKENCRIAKNNLAQLNLGGHLRYRNEKGDYVNMSEEERQKRIAEANQQVEQFCGKDSE